MKKIFTSIVSFLLLFTLSVSQLTGETNITILHTNDTHSHLMPFDSKEHGPDSGGIVRRSGLIKSIRNQLGNVLLLDAGDILQGTPFYIIFKGEACYKTAAECG
ncbi:MAG: bifunctional metallophosphatase/5'-nucleotidase, partial [Erysipelotrichia bacterium]|nr:bifunctional metallophosphatase/5'-nucleotidase [Erysipelotrichia bacterium]